MRHLSYGPAPKTFAQRIFGIVKFILGILLLVLLFWLGMILKAFWSLY